MNKEQAEVILRKVIDEMRLTRKEYETLLQAIHVLKMPTPDKDVDKKKESPLKQEKK